MSYDYLIVGAGLFGSVFAHEMTKLGKKCLVIDRREHIGGNCYTKNCDGINVHVYGAHIFHTSDKEVWDYVNRFAEFNNFINSPVANYKGELYNLPFNMNTFYRLWGTVTPQEAAAEIERQRGEIKGEPKNLEEQAIKLVGRDVYQKLIEGYTRKQWGRPCDQLPAFIIKRLPVRFTYDNNYFTDRYQGIPEGGYTAIFQKLLSGIETRLGCDYFSDRQYFDSIAEKVVYTGRLDEYFDLCYGELDYRGLRFETEALDIPNYQGNAVVNYTEYEIPYTRIIEHKHFEHTISCNTVITREYPAQWQHGDEPYYPVNDERNDELCGKYRALADQKQNVIFGGRLGTYKYLDMHAVIRQALDAVKAEKEQCTK